MVVAPVVGGAFVVAGATRVVVVVRARRDAGDEHAARPAISTTTARARTPYGRVVARTVLTPTCVWRATTGLVIALDGRFGEPVDAYVNGSQVWLRDDGPGGITVEWRLHPVAGYRRPPGLDTYDVLSEVARALAAGDEPPAPLDRLWDGLEAFPAYGDEVEPATLAATVADALGIPPDAAGLVDHGRIGDEWEKSEGAVSIVARLLEQLGAG